MGAKGKGSKTGKRRPWKGIWIEYLKAIGNPVAIAKGTALYPVYLLVCGVLSLVLYSMEPSLHETVIAIHGLGKMSVYLTYLFYTQNTRNRHTRVMRDILTSEQANLR